MSPMGGQRRSQLCYEGSDQANLQLSYDLLQDLDCMPWRSKLLKVGLERRSGKSKLSNEWIAVLVNKSSFSVGHERCIVKWVKKYFILSLVMLRFGTETISEKVKKVYS